MFKQGRSTRGGGWNSGGQVPVLASKHAHEYQAEKLEKNVEESKRVKKKKRRMTLSMRVLLTGEEEKDLEPTDC